MKTFETDYERKIYESCLSFEIEVRLMGLGHKWLYDKQFEIFLQLSSERLTHYIMLIGLDENLKQKFNDDLKLIYDEKPEYQDIINHRINLGNGILHYKEQFFQFCCKLNADFNRSPTQSK